MNAYNSLYVYSQGVNFCELFSVPKPVLVMRNCIMVPRLDPYACTKKICSLHMYFCKYELQFIQIYCCILLGDASISRCLQNMIFNPTPKKSSLNFHYHTSLKLGTATCQLGTMLLDLLDLVDIITFFVQESTSAIVKANAG